jgi:ABC-type branched-subunit amino acid transport system ATPase component
MNEGRVIFSGTANAARQDRLVIDAYLGAEVPA